MNAIAFSRGVLIGLAMVAPAVSHAAALFPARSLDWAAIQATGGMKSGPAFQRGDAWILPVEYDVHGLRAITRKPTVIHSAPHVCRWQVKRESSRILIRASSRLTRKSEEFPARYELELPLLEPGCYAVFYDDQSAGNPWIGSVEICAGNGGKSACKSDSAD